MRKPISLDGASAAVDAAARYGRSDRRSLAGYDLDMSGRCKRPVGVALRAEPDTPRDTRLLDVPSDGHPVFLDLDVRCRRCSACLKARAALWRGRARFEIEHAERTWFGTLTLRPEERVRAAFEAQLAASAREGEVPGMETPDGFKVTAQVAGREVTKFLKRVRSETGAILRYLVVTERSADGTPHWHLLLHEYRPEGSARKAMLEKQWRLGFSSWRLVKDANAANYICKYLSKDILARVRASLGYGTRGLPPEALAHSVNLTPPQHGVW